MLKKENLQDVYTLSLMQEGILFHALYDKDSAAYFQQMSYEVSGQFDIDIFRSSWNALVRRHDILRTVFIHKNVPRPLQFVLKDREIDFYTEDIRNVSDPQVYVEAFKAKDRQKSFDLSKDMLIRVSVLRQSEQSYHIILSFHHILMDGWCMPIIQSELLEIYAALKAGKQPVLAPVTRYRDYIQWLERQDKQASLAYWANYLSGYEHLATLPKKQGATGYVLQKSTIEFDKHTGAKLSALASRHQVTLNTVFQTLWGILLCRYNDRNDVVFGVTVSGRPPQIEGVERMVGLFINTIPLRVQIESEQSFDKLLQKVQQDNFSSSSHHYYSLADIQANSPLKQGLTDHIMVFESFPADNSIEDKALGFAIEQTDEFEQTNYDLEITVFPGERIHVRFGFNAQAFSPAQIETLGRHFENAVHSVLSNNSISVRDIEIFDNEEKEFLLNGLNNTYRDYPRDKSIIDLFEKQVKEKPDDIAVISGNQTLSYKTLNERVNRIAHYLRKTYHIQPDDPVGIMADRSEWLIIGILGIIKSGAAYIPIDPEYPQERIDYIIENSACKAIVTEAKYLADIPASVTACDIRAIQETEISDPEKIILPHNLAYIIYTSGSTGKPKGVMLTHQDVVSFNVNMTEVFGFTPSDRMLALTTITFDISVLELITSLLTGMSVVISPDAEIREPQEILDNIGKYQVSALQITPSRLKLLLENQNISVLANLRVLLIGGEPLPTDLFERLTPLFAATDIFNVYGPTEATIWSTAKKLNDGILNIGKPLMNESVLILSQDGQLVPFGVVGEICIGGDGLARGYYQRPDLTADRFIPHPFKSGERIYRTGDSGRWLADGNIECLGRTDDQIKIRGYRIELGEIEACLKKHPVIREAVVVAKDKDSTTRELAAYFISTEELSIADLRNFLSRSLPEYMLPTWFVRLEKLPLTPNGKTDKKALPDPRQTGLKPDTEHVSPRNELEQKLAGIWQEILQMPGIGIYDNFFDLGGHSLKATRIVSKIHKDMGIEIRLRDMFTFPTIAGLAEIIRQKDSSTLIRITPIHKAEYYALSHSQRRLWILDQMEGGFVAYNMPSAYRINGGLDIPAFQKAVHSLVMRHESLRTVFVIIDGEPKQLIRDSINNVLEIITESDPVAVHKEVNKEAATPFDLSEGPLFRVKLLRIAENEHILILNMHHIISDAWSSDVLTKDLLMLYQAYAAGHEPSLPELKIQYKDYAAWQNALLASDQVKDSITYWKSKLSGELPVLQLPTDLPRPPVQTYKGKTFRLTLNEEITNNLKAFAKSRNASLFMILMAMLKVLLHRYTNQEDIIIGSPVSGRIHPDLEHQIGFYVNTLALRDEVKPEDSFVSVLEKVKQTTLDAYQHQIYPFDRLPDDLKLSRDLSRAPIFDVMLVLANQASPLPQPKGLNISEYEIDASVSKFDLSFEVAEKQTHLDIGINYNTDLFKEDTIRRMASHIEALSTSLIQEPNQPVSSLNMLSNDERQAVLFHFNNHRHPFPQDKTLSELFEEQVRKTPNHIALIYNDVSMTYSELDQAAESMAMRLREHHIRPQLLIGMMCERNEKAIIALLGILKAGCVYLPIDPLYPHERIGYMLQDSRCQCLISHDDKISVFENNESVSHISLAYIIYTSGSTGKPKGVMIGHRSFVNMISEQIRGFDVRESDRVLQFASLSFDASLSEIFMALLCGAALVIADKETIEDPKTFLSYLDRHKVSVATLPPGYLNALNRQIPEMLRTIITAGEPAIVADALFYSSNKNYFNAYGPTEISVCASYYRVLPDSPCMPSVPIGKPIANTEIFILNDDLNPVPIGIPGEICIAGEGLAAGYLNKPEMTAEKFIPHPFKPGELMYRSGDLGKWLSDGNIVFLGRKDEQVKVRGYRIEPGEIESLLLQYPSVSEAAVIVKNKDLIAYVAPEQANLSELRSYLRQTLPDYMIPVHIIPLVNIPLTPNRKVDKKSLPDPESVRSKPLADDVMPRNDMEKQIAAVWEKVLERKPIGIYDNFFDLGGNSLKAVQIIMSMSAALGRDISVKLLFIHSTIAELCEAIGNE
jgi:amino acid adenylation domain-containing protein